jgi:ATP-dependent Clp protease protease subunit
VPKDGGVDRAGDSWEWAHFGPGHIFSNEQSINGCCGSPDEVWIRWGLEDAKQAEVIAHELSHMCFKQKGYFALSQEEQEEIVDKAGKDMAASINWDQAERDYWDWLVNGPDHWADKPKAAKPAAAKAALPTAAKIQNRRPRPQVSPTMSAAPFLAVLSACKSARQRRESARAEKPCGMPCAVGGQCCSEGGQCESGSAVQREFAAHTAGLGAAFRQELQVRANQRTLDKAAGIRQSAHGRRVQAVGSANSADLYIYGDIEDYPWYDSDVSAETFRQDLESVGDVGTLNVYINSMGGSVFQAQSIHSQLRRHSAHVNIIVDGLAASAASYIIPSADNASILTNAMVMVHNPMAYVVMYMLANTSDLDTVIAELTKTQGMLTKTREAMISAYQVKSPLSRDEWAAMLDAETWMTAEEAVASGLADEILGADQAVASLSAIPVRGVA